jgi:mRNA interferase MazF
MRRVYAIKRARLISLLIGEIKNFYKIGGVVMLINIERGDIWQVDLGENKVGSEQGGVRPCVIIQNNVGNHYSSTTIVAVITSAMKRVMPTHFVIGKHDGLSKTSICLCEQVFVVDKSRLTRYIGKLSDEKIALLDKCLSVSLGLHKNYK